MTTTPSFPPADAALEAVARLREQLSAVDYRKHALQFRSAVMTAVAFTLIAGQFTRRYAETLRPQVVELLRFLADWLESGGPEPQAPVAEPPVSTPTAAAETPVEAYAALAEKLNAPAPAKAPAKPRPARRARTAAAKKPADG